MFSITRGSPATRSLSATLKCAPSGPVTTSIARTSACGLKPYVTMRRSETRGIMAWTSGWSMQSAAKP
jgi:hypothetical protein